MGRRQVADCSVVMLRGTVQHFMQLFDVTQVSGCYARMSDIYGRLGEVENMLKSLKNMLGLGECFSLCYVYHLLFMISRWFETLSSL